MHAVGFLQNAWSPVYAGQKWPRDSWLKALHRSRSGQRLRVLLENCRPVTIWFDNTTPEVGDNPDSLLAPDLFHVQAVLRQQAPDIIVGFGKQAGQVLLGLQTPLPILLLPHPGYRVLTNELYATAGKLLSRGIEGVTQLSQRHGHIEILEGAAP